LARFTQEAPAAFWKKSIRRREFQEKYGKLLGTLIWRVSLLTKFPVVAAIKDRCMRLKKAA